MERRYFDEKETDFNILDFVHGGNDVNTVHEFAN